MKATKLTIGTDALKPMTMEELMLTNALVQIDTLEEEIRVLRGVIRNQTRMLDALQSHASFDPDFGGVISIGWIRKEDPEYQNLMSRFELTETKEEPQAE